MGVSPYSTGGGGVTFERKVAVQYLTHLLVGDTATELGDGRRVVNVAFQQAPLHSVDDLLVCVARPDESEPSLVVALGIRRSPNLVGSDSSSQKLIRQFVREVRDAPVNGPDHRLGLVVSGAQAHAQQLSELAHLASAQMDAAGFFDLVRTPNKFDVALRNRLDQLGELVRHALNDLGVTEPSAALVQEHTWRLLSKLTVRMPRLESPDETDWSTVVNDLARVARDSDLTTASLLRDRLVALTDDYSPRAARTDLTMLRCSCHALLDSKARRHQKGWQVLNGIHQRARDSVRTEVASGEGGHSVCLDRNPATKELIEALSGVDAVVVSGESGVGKSALAVSGLAVAADADPDALQVICVDLRQVPSLPITLEGELEQPLSRLLCELSAPQRVLVVDGADAIVEGKQQAFRYLAAAAQDSGIKVIAVTSVDSKQVVRDALNERFDTGIEEYVVPLLGDTEIEEVVGTFTELAPLNANPRSREILRRLVVVDLLVRGRVSGIPLTDADAMNEVWSSLVRRREMCDRGFPDARETAMLRLAKLELEGGEPLEVISGMDPAAVDGLRRDGLLRPPRATQFKIEPEFAHDEVRRYAVARLLLGSDNPASALLATRAPRWSLAASQLACQAWLQQPETSTNPLEGRFSTLQASFDALGAGYGSRWGDVPGEALLRLADPETLLRDAWPGLRADDAAGLRRLVRLVDQRLCDDNGIVDVVAVAPIIALLLEDPAPWRSGEYAEGLLRTWLRGHVVAQTGAGHRLRILLRERLVETCATADRRWADERQTAVAARAARPSAEIERERQFKERYGVLYSELGYGDRRRRQRPEVPHGIKDKVILELMALLGPDLGDDGEATLSRVAKEAPSWLGPAVDEFFTGQALASGRRGLLAELTEAYYLDDEVDVDEIRGLEDGVRCHHGHGLFVPQAAWYRGPFMPLFQSDFRNGVRMLNRLLNHAARVRARTLMHPNHSGGPLESDSVGLYENELGITGVRQLYVGDEHVWRWYRGSAVGPYPCFSALQALERVCDELIVQGIPIKELVAILLDGCENLAMVGFIVGFMVRHLEQANHLLDPYLTEPFIWRQEFVRVASEASPLAPDSEEVVASDRRNWSFREAAMFMVMQADDDRAPELRALGETLVANAGHLIEPKRDHQSMKVDSRREFNKPQLVHVRAWASSLDRDSYQAHKTQDGFYLASTPPAEVVEALQDSSEDLELGREATRLFVRDRIDPKKEDAPTIGVGELVADIAASRKLLENPPSLRVHDPWDIAALVAAAALEAHFVEDADLSDDALSFAAETVLGVGEGVAGPRQFEFEEAFFEAGADRSVARVLPLLLLPIAAQLRAAVDGKDGSTTFERAFCAGVNLARAVPYEVRLHLARGLDHVWKTPCLEYSSCHHELGWRIAIETMRWCLLDAWDPDTGRRGIVPLEEPVIVSLAGADSDSILVARLDAAIRALAPAAMADICISTQARELLSALLAAQRRSLLNYGEDDRVP